MSITCILLLTAGVVSLLVALVWGSAFIRHSFYVSALCRGDHDKRSVAITFDDGPDPLHTPEVLDVLARHGVHATFFLIGEKVKAYPEPVRRIVEEGHTVGIHTMRHKAYFPLLPTCCMIEELKETRDAIQRITGQQPKLFRPPFGVTNPTVRKSVHQLNLTTIGWSIRSLDTVSRTPRSRVLARIVRKLRPGAVILLHDRCMQSATMTEQLLQALADRNYCINTVEQMFNIKAYEN